MEKLYTVKEIAAQRLLGYGERTIRELIKSWELETIDVRRAWAAKPSYRVKQSVLNEFLKKKEIDSLAKSK
jgi:hypothetical protein